VKALIKYALFALVIFSTIASSQTGQPPAPPGVDIFVADFSERGGNAKAGKPANITKRQGYDNQPSFTPDGAAILYTSIREDKQADTYRYVIKTGGAMRLTATPESEYSPTVTPDRKHFSVIRVEADSTQRLWEFPLSGGEPLLILGKIKPVGYHLWVDADTLAVFVLGTPNTLRLVEKATEKAETISENVGRSIRLAPGAQAVTFVHKISADNWEIKTLNIKTRKTNSLIKTLPGSEDFVWTPEGALLMAKDAKLFRFNPSTDKDWKEVADFSDQGIKAITRLAISPRGDKIAFVAADAL
jgi:tricorn protease-like protein